MFRARNIPPPGLPALAAAARSPASPPRPPAPRRSRRWPRPCAAPARTAAWCSTCRSTPSPPTIWPATGCRAEDEEMAALRESLRAHGQRTPIEVTPLVTGRALPYGLISGWRRLDRAARRSMPRPASRASPPSRRWSAARRPPPTPMWPWSRRTRSALGLSHYERARVAARATERGVFPSEKAALLALFATASRAKRSRIRAFLELYHALDGILRFPAALPERLGLRLVEKVRAGGRGRHRRRHRRRRPAHPGGGARDPDRAGAAPPAARGGPSPSARAAPARGDARDALRGRALTLRLKAQGVTPELRDAVLAPAAPGARPAGLTDTADRCGTGERAAAVLESH